MYIYGYQLQLECACIDRPKLERDHDLFLMDEVCAKSKEEVSDANVRIINYCRNYLEVQRLSDICTADGQFILKSVWDGDLCITQSQSRLDEIIQEKPAKKEWTQWRKLLKSFCHDYTIPNFYRAVVENNEIIIFFYRRHILSIVLLLLLTMMMVATVVVAVIVFICVIVDVILFHPSSVVIVIVVVIFIIIVIDIVVEVFIVVVIVADLLVLYCNGVAVFLLVSFLL